MPLTIARIDKATGVVINIELADQEWIDAQADDPDCAFVPYTPEAPASIGGRHDPVTGFEQAVVEELVTVPVAKLDALGLTVKQRASLGLEP